MKSGDPNRQLEFILLSVSNLLRRIYNERYCDIDINGSRVKALIYLERSRDGMIQSEIAELLALGKAAAGTMIAGLENDGMVRRVENPLDQRVKIVQITDRGKEVVQTAERATSDLRGAIREGTSKQERREVIRLLEIMRDNLVELEEQNSRSAVPDLKKRHKRSLESSGI